MKTSQQDPRIEAALRGKTIYGDDFSRDKIDAWFRDEVNGYASLEHMDSQTDYYAYHAMDAAYAWRYVKGSHLRVLGLGSAYGSEFRPMASRIESLTIVEPAEKFWRSEVAGLPAQFLRPDPSGRLPFDTKSFDLATAFGVLHHIPNVSTVLAELIRVLKPGGQLTIREPITSMGDWRQPRRGLTAHERGIPKDQLAALALANGCTVTSAAFIGFAPLIKLVARNPAASPSNSPHFVRVDRWLSRAFEWNYSYHRTYFLRRFAPTVGCWVLTKSHAGDARP